MFVDFKKQRNKLNFKILYVCNRLVLDSRQLSCIIDYIHRRLIDLYTYNILYSQSYGSELNRNNLLL